MSLDQHIAKALEVLPKGVFLTTAMGESVNTMTISWGSIGHVWNKPVFMVMVRPSRHTYTLLEKSAKFSVSVPLGNMKEELAICGSKSGRDTNKFELCNLELLEGRAQDVPVIKGCGLHFECKVLHKQAMEFDMLGTEIKEAWYPTENCHVMYYGEIVASYEEEL